MKPNRRISAFFICFLFISSLICCQHASFINQKKDTPSSHNRLYLKEYFDLDIPETATVDAIHTIFKTVSGGESIEGFSNNTTTVYNDVIKMAVVYADFAELSKTYDAGKAKQVVSKYGSNSKIPPADLPILACALDVKIIRGADLSKSRLNRAVTSDDVANIAMAIASRTHHGRNFLGFTSDEDIFSRLDVMWKKARLIETSILSTLGTKGVKKGFITGYSLTHEDDFPRFLPAKSLYYSHSNIKHARQLIGLLISERIMARVALQPKTSAYRYLLKWGPIKEPTSQYAVRKEGTDFYVAYALEYNLVFEFMRDEDRWAFEGIILAYAKKNSINPKNKMLIYKSWWQPLYYSLRTIESYSEIYDILIANKKLHMHSFCLPEDLQDVKTGFNQINSTLSIDHQKIWVGKPFYRYLKGRSE